MDDSYLLDWDLDVDTVSRLVKQQFPALGGERIVRLGAGWDHELYSVGEDWILRFPKRADRVPWLLREIEIMQVAADALEHLVARFELLGRPDSGCPYPFVGYRRLIGAGADQAGHVGRALAADIGQALSRLHRVPVDRIPPTPGGGEADSWDQLAMELQSVAKVVQPLLSEDLLARARPYLSGRRRPPPGHGPQRAIHNDMCPDHLIVDPRSGRLTGIIDFSDTTVGDPVLDMVGLIGLGGYQFIADVLSSYDLELGEGFADRLIWRARVRTLGWLADAATHDRPGIPKHVGWVTAALADPPASIA